VQSLAFLVLDRTNIHFKKFKCCWDIYRSLRNFFAKSGRKTVDNLQKHANHHEKQASGQGP